MSEVVEKRPAWTKLRREALRWLVPLCLAFLALLVLYGPIFFFIGKMMETF